MKYIEGEQVLAKHPVLLEYHRGTVLGIRGDRYKIKFDTGGEHTLNEIDIQYQRASRSTNRTSSRVSKKSPSRSSPGTKSSGGRPSPSRRSPSRRSPSRRSPSRRSPGRSSTSSSASSRKLPVRNTSFAKVSLSRVDYDESNHKEEISMQVLEKKQIEMIPLQQRLNEIVRHYRIKQFSNVNNESNLGQSTRNTDRAASLPLERNIYVHDYLPEETNRENLTQRHQTLKKFREDEKWEEVATHEEICKLDKPQEWGGWIGTSLLTFILPLSFILPQFLFWKEQTIIVCSKKTPVCSKQLVCEYAVANFSNNLESYVHLHGLLAYGLFLILLAFASILPIGKTVYGTQSKIGRLRYRTNGFHIFIVAMVAFSFCLYKEIPIDDYILNNIVQLSVSGWILGTVLALGLYVKAERAPIANLNIYASTNSKTYNFWQGREINPRIGTLDIKLLLIRASFIGTLIVDMAIVVNHVNNHSIFLSLRNVDEDYQLHVVTFLICGLRSAYIILDLLEEDFLLTSFEIMYEGTGYMMAVSRLLHPFLMTLTIRFMLYQNTKPSFFNFIFILSFAMGLFLYWNSNLSKHNFRKNPVAQAVSSFETISTLRGKKLILSAGWGYVRHPNYLGNIIMHWSLAALSWTTSILPYYPAIWFTLMLAYRAIRDNRRCQTRYGYAWKQYCSCVKYMILKGVF